MSVETFNAIANFRKIQPNTQHLVLVFHLFNKLCMYAQQHLISHPFRCCLISMSNNQINYLNSANISRDAHKNNNINDNRSRKKNENKKITKTISLCIYLTLLFLFSYFIFLFKRYTFHAVNIISRCFTLHIQFYIHLLVTRNSSECTTKTIDINIHRRHFYKPHHAHTIHRTWSLS